MNKTKVQRTTQGQFFILLPEEMIRIVKWREGDEVEVWPGSETGPRAQDLVLRKV
ncbi:MAG: hypothetical protein HY555_05595 [Euryarchaeota archaeon]|nr:hypothetical protein [Euryarchaeota archaeon]